MAFTLDAAQVSEAKNVLASLGYHNASAEDIALTLQHMGEAWRCGAERQSSAVMAKHEKSSSDVSISPPRGSNDITVGPHDERKAVGRSDEGNRRPTSASLNQAPGASSCSLRERPATTARQAAKWRYPRRGREQNREYLHQQPFYSAASAVVQGGNQRFVGAAPRGTRYVDFVGADFVSDGKTTAVRDAVTIPTGTVAAKGRRDGKSYPTLVDYMNPQARLERHLNRYERGLRTLYANRCEEDGRDGALKDEEDGDVRCAEEAEDYLPPAVDSEEGENNLAFFYGDHTNRLLMPEMPLRPSCFLLNRRNANTLYNFTGDARYKYRGGLGVPLCAVLGPNGSTLRQRADPVRRGQQMREIWGKNRFITQHCRTKDRWSTN